MTKHQKHSATKTPVQDLMIKTLRDLLRQASDERFTLWQQKRILTEALEDIRDWCNCQEGECPSAIAHAALEASSKEAHPSGQPST